MSVEFNEPQYQTSSPVYTQKEKGIVGLIMKTGLVKDKKQANLVMIGIIVVMAIIFFISISSMGNGGGNDYTPEEYPEGTNL